MKFRSSVTFESDKQEPVHITGEVDASPDEAIRKAVFRAMKSAPRKYDSMVVVIERVK